MAADQPVATFITQSEEFLRNRHVFYKPLDPSRQEIRIMHIRPGRDEDAIHVELYNVDLADEPFYEAISYTWDDMSVTKQVYIHDVAYNVTVNQYAALRRLRRPNETKILWMDVICIDQASLQERAHQVSIMGDVYTNAAHTDIWIGELGESSCTPMSDETWNHHVTRWESFKNTKSFFEITASRLREQLMAEFLQIDSLVERAVFILYQLETDIHVRDLPFGSVDGEDVTLCRQWYDGVNMLHEILKRPWWTRVWVLQEFLLCKGDPQVLFGPYELPLDTLVKISEGLLKHTLIDRCCMDSLLPVFFSEDVLYYLIRLTSVSLVIANHKPGRMSLYSAVLLTQERKVTDPRDYVYGVLGLIDPKDRVKVDYTLTAGAVFASTSWFGSRLSNNFTWLAEGALPGGSRTPMIPTWSIDWADIGRVGFKLNGSWEMDEEPDWERTKYNGNLELAANQVAEIGLVLVDIQDDYALSDCRNAHTRLWKWLKGLENAGLETHCTRWTADNYRDEEFFFHFFSTIFRDTMADIEISFTNEPRRLGEQDWQAIWRMWSTLNHCMEAGTEQMYPGNELRWISTMCGISSQDSTLALTIENELCLVPDNSKAGDYLYHVRSCCPPLVLRDVGADAFQVVGPAYHRGLMGSQGWRKDEEKVITLI